MSLAIRLDLEIQVPKDTPPEERYRLEEDLESGARYNGQFKDTTLSSNGFRWSYAHIFEAPDSPLSIEVYNSLSHKHREILKGLVINSGVRDDHLKALWRHVGKMVPVEVYWTVVEEDRREDIYEEVGQDEFNSIMLSPLEQLATLG